MAIIIPSAKTYDRNNPKVRDNVIERIEVNAKKISPFAKNDTPFHTEEIVSTPIPQTPQDLSKIAHSISSEYRHYFYARVETQAEYFIIDEIKVPIVSNNSYAKSLILGKNETSQESNITYSLPSVKYEKGETNGALELTSLQNSGIYSGTFYKPPTSVEILSLSFDKAIRTITENTYVANDASLVLTLTADDETNLASIESAKIIEEDGKDYFLLENIKILAAIKKGRVHGDYYKWDNNITEEDIIYCEGDYEYYKASMVNITFNANVIGIDLTDNTVYINGETAKKVHSIDGNELMQTKNYILDGNGTKTNALDKMYGDTKKQYAKGKETATIRCSIGDYYDGDNKAISIDKQRNLSTDIATARAVLSGSSYNVRVTLQQAFEKNVKAKISWLNNVGYKVKRTLTILAGETVAQTYAGLYRPTNIKVESISLETPMCFEVGDQVIPMVYGANGQDRPMSLYSDMTPKIFQVLAVKPYYDGAVWQELTLQEVAQTE